MSDASIGIKCTECDQTFWFAKDVRCSKVIVTEETTEKMNDWFGEHQICCFNLRPGRGVPYPFVLVSVDR